MCHLNAIVLLSCSDVKFKLIATTIVVNQSYIYTPVFSLLDQACEDCPQNSGCYNRGSTTATTTSPNPLYEEVAPAKEEIELKTNEAYEPS